MTTFRIPHDLGDTIEWARDLLAATRESLTEDVLISPYRLRSIVEHAERMQLTMEATQARLSAQVLELQAIVARMDEQLDSPETCFKLEPERGPVEDKLHTLLVTHRDLLARCGETP